MAINSKICAICSKTFSKGRQNLTWWKSAKFCSQSCYQQRIVQKSTKQKMSKTAIGNKNGLGYKHTEDAKLRISAALSLRRIYPIGSRKPNPRANRMYRDWRLTILLRDAFTCQMCGIRGEKARLEVDHIKPFALYPELRFDSLNVRTLCRECHKLTPTYGFKVFTYGKRT